MKVFAVCDSEINYARKLVEKLSDTCGEELFLTQLFDSAEAVLGYQKNIRIEALLLGDKVVLGTAEDFCDTIARFRRAGINKIFVLTSDKRPDEKLKEYKCFYKYQAATTLIKEIVQAYMQASVFERTKEGEKPGQTEVIGVFAPVNCVEKTIWALLAGMILAKERPVLYLNLERYAGFDTILGRQHDADLSEVFYYILHGEQTGEVRIKEAVQSFKGLSYIPPIRFGRELFGMPGDAMLHCIERIVGLSKKDAITEKTIIIDFSGSAEKHIELCNMCDRIFLVQRNDCITKAMVEAFEHECEILSEQELVGKIRKVHTAVLREQIGERFLELNLEGEFGEKIKQILRGEGLFDGEIER